MVDLYERRRYSRISSPRLSGSANASRTFLGTGSNLLAPNKYLNEFNLGPLAPLAPGTYWLVLHNGSVAQNQYTGFFWAITAPNSSLISQQSAIVSGGFGTNISGWIANNNQLAFQLTLVTPAPPPTPLPPSIILALTGLAASGLCLARRKFARPS